MTKASIHRHLSQLIKVVRLHHTSTFKDVWQTLTTFCE